MEVPNRFYFAPHGAPGWILGMNDGSASEDLASYLAERAAGGVGLVIDSMLASPRARFNWHSPYSEDAIPSFRVVSDAVHKHGAKIFGQLNLGGSRPRWDLVSPPAPRFGHINSSASEIAALIAAVRQCSDHLRLAGFDGIEIHANHGSTEEQFLSPYFNKRTDAYGGDLEGRMRLLVELLQAAREGAGTDLAVGIRYNCDELLPGGLTQADTHEIVPQFVKRNLVDFVHFDLALEPLQHDVGQPIYFFEPLTLKHFVAAVRDAAAPVPVLSVLGRVTSAADAEQALAEGAVDMVGAARGLIAEPELMKNAREGHESRSRTCIAANMCRFISDADGGWGCAINPATGHERQWGAAAWTPAPHRSRVVVVGGGPAGLEAARIAARRGHDVVLFESNDRIGGQLNLWSKLPGREVIATTVAWYEHQLKELGIDLRAGVRASADLVLAEQPAAVIVAAGSRYSTRLSPSAPKPGIATPGGPSSSPHHIGSGADATDRGPGDIPTPIPGHERELVHGPEQILEDGLRLSGTVVVFDAEGLNTGVGVAEFLARSGSRVHLVTSRPQPGESLVLTFEIRSILPRLRALGVTMTTHAFLRAIGAHEVTLYDSLRATESVLTGVDAVVLVTMRAPQNALAKELEGKVPQLFLIGDALEPRTLIAATYEGHRFARLIGEDGTPRDFTEAYWRIAPSERTLRPAVASH